MAVFARFAIFANFAIFATIMRDLSAASLME